jgi:hypothetical protein
MNKTIIDFTAAPALPDWQEVQFELPSQGQIIHLRLLLPAGETDIRRIELSPPEGKITKAWTFELKGAEER